MALTFYDTGARALRPFEPDDPDAVRVYACGPTIYDHAHIGNFRAFVVYDLLHRYLEWRGYGVRFVMNLTDVDDKTISGASAEGVALRDFTEPFGQAFLETCETLGIRPADSYPRATEYVGRMVDFVETLVEKGHAYTTDDGSVYFSISSFPEYGKLSGVDLERVRPGARVDVDEYGKDDVRDFALWKAARPEDEEVGAAWDSPWGRGRPGWHLECSVMSTGELGDTLDVHLGGEDLVFPHHEDEIAQSEAATGEPFVRYWLHVKHLHVEGRKMSKSLGNFILVKELLDEGYDPAAIRHQLLGSHYRAELNFTREGLEASARALQRLLDFEDRVEAVPVDPSADAVGLEDLADEAMNAFRAAMDHDLNSADALAALFVLVTKVNAVLDGAGSVPPGERAAVLDTFRSMDEVLGLVGLARTSRSLDPETEAWVESMIEERTRARTDRDFERADEIRDELLERGVLLEDGPDGTRWKYVPDTRSAVS